MGTPSKLREFKAIIQSSASTTFTNANSETWDAATKYEVIAYDDSGLKYDGIEDPALRTRRYGRGPNIPGFADGTVKFSVWAGGAYSNVDPHPQALLCNAILGGLTSPTTNRNSTAGSGCTDVNINITSAGSYLTAGQAVLVGTKGDGRGNGEVKPIAIVGTNYIYLSIACNAAPNSGDAVVFSTTVYPSAAGTQKYIDITTIGGATADQRQMIGAMGTVKVSGAYGKEPPKFDFELSPIDHRYVPANERRAMNHAATPAGTDPAFTKGIGAFQLIDASGTTRSVYKAGDFEIDFGVTYEAIPDPAGSGGRGGWVKMPGAPKITATLLMDEDMPGLYDDFVANTAKKCMLQFGHEKTKTMAFDMTTCYVDSSPTTKEINNLSGVSVSLHGEDAYVSDAYLTRAAPFRIHFF